MTAATATTSRTPRSPWSSRSSTTPLGHPARTPSSVGQNIVPPLTPQARSPLSKQGQTSSPSYFGLTVDAETENPVNSDAGGYARKNWRTPASSNRSHATTASPKIVPHEANPGLAAFRKQSQSKTFQLDGGNFGSVTSPTRPSSSRTNSKESGYISPRSQRNNENNHLDSSSGDAMDIDEISGPAKSANDAAFGSNTMLLDLPRRESPASLPTLSNTAQGQLSRVDERHPRLSLPQNRVEKKNEVEEAFKSGRSSTLPSPLSSDSGGSPSMIMPQALLDLLRSIGQDKILILDVRVSPQYTQSRVSGSLNLCIPTTLLKRPSFNTQKLKETFTLDEEKERFSRWRDLPIMVLYDANSHQLKDATSAVNTMKKFTNEGWQGASYIVRGGFQEISKKCPEMIEKAGVAEHDPTNSAQLSIDSRAAGSLQVAGGLAMPSTKTAANPFFGNIRQNMDLIGGVGQMPIKHPDALTYKSFKILPKWLQRAAEEGNKGKTVSEEFLALEQEEQKRMKAALSTDVHYSNAAATPATSKSIQIAGIEKGTKNRYKDILPFNHTRVKLQNVPKSECDYINASHVKAEWSNRRYIAAQAPVPATFGDFWRVVWEQDARVIVMLSAESEGGQRKCHPYWVPDDYGPMKLKTLSEKKVYLGSTTPAASSSSSSSSNSLAPDNYRNPLLTPQPERLLASRRRATNPFGAAAQEAARDQSASLDAEVPHVIVRHLTLSHSSYPFEPMREITQLQYSNWPDFGAPAHPTDLLGLISHCNAVIRGYNKTSSNDASQPAKPDERPVVVHCSAGCGRTGTFCTVDSVIDMLKRQRAAKKAAANKLKEGDEMEVDSSVDDWVQDDEEDLIAKTVKDFRVQRLSMVQTLRQYVLCYETILEWLVKEMPEKYRRDAMRKSYGG